jgi:hypothetical protein
MSDQSEYFAHVRRQELEYLLAYEEWERSLSASDRALAGKMAAPDLEDFHARSSKRESLGVVGDAAERSLASYTPDLASNIDDETSILAERAGLKAWQAREIYRYIEERVERRVTEAKCNVIVRVCGVFLKAGSNVKLLVAGLAYAADLAVTNQLGTMQDWAVRNGLSRAAVSKVAKFWQRELGLPASSHMRGEEKCQAYSEAQTQKHWRKQKVGGLSRIWDGLLSKKRKQNK